MNLKAAIMVLAMLASAAPAAAQEWRGDGDGHGRGRAEHGWRGRGPDGNGPPGQRGRIEGEAFVPPGQRGRGYPAPAPYGLPVGQMLGFGAPPAAPASWQGGDQAEARRAVREGRHVSLGQAIDAIRRRTPGRQLDAEMEPGPGGRHVYRVRWATADGRRIDYIVDAETGAIIGEGR